MYPLVLLPGMNCTQDLWTKCDLGEVIYPVLSRPTMTEQVETLLQQLPERFVLGGLSLGAIVAMAVALKAPERLVGLCLSATNAGAPTAAQRESWQQWAERIGEGPKALQQSILPALLSEQTRRYRPDLVERVLQMGEQTGPDLLLAQLKLQASRVDLLDRLADLSIPSLVIYGRQDEICPAEYHEKIAAQLPIVRLASVGGGHLVPLEHPAEFSEIVASWRTEYGI